MAVSPLDTVLTLEARAREARLRRQERERAVRQAVEATVRSRRPPGARAWLIGSLAWGEFTESSDVDVVLDGWPPASLAELERAVAAVAGAAVDLLELGELPAGFQERIPCRGGAPP